MDKSADLFDISRTDEARILHALHRQASTDPELTPREVAEISDAISRRFGALNRPTTAPKGRW